MDALSDEEREIAAFWNCNPFAVQDNGHLLIGLKNLTWCPLAGHYRHRLIKRNKNFAESMQIHTIILWS